MAPCVEPTSFREYSRWLLRSDGVTDETFIVAQRKYAAIPRPGFWDRGCMQALLLTMENKYPYLQELRERRCGRRSPVGKELNHDKEECQSGGKADVASGSCVYESIVSSEIDNADAERLKKRER